MTKTLRCRRLFRSVVALLPLLLISGCVHRSESGSKIDFRYELWVPLAVLVGGFVAAPLGWVIRKRSARYGWALLILGPIAALGFAPSLFMDRVTVSDEGFQVQTGIWGITSVHDVTFANLQSLKITSEVTTGRRKRTNYYFLCDMKQGPQIKVPVNNEVAKASVESILERVASHKIPIINATENEQ